MKNLNQVFRFCQHCGSENLVTSEQKKVECLDCGQVYFHNVAAAVAVIIQRGDKLLFTRRNIEPGRGMLDLAGGFVDPLESAEETVVRELNEELRFTIDSSGFKFLFSLPNLYIYKGVPYHTCDLIFHLRFEGEITYTDPHEIQELVWLEKDQVKIEDIGFQSIKLAIKRFLDS